MRSPSNDIPIPRSSWQSRNAIRIGSLSVIGLLVVACIWLLRSEQRSVRVPVKEVTIAIVEKGVFHDFIPLRCKVVPHDTIYLDALEGGRIEKVLVRPGDRVDAGQPLVLLSNAQLELDVLDRQARIVESITQLQTYQTQLEQNLLNNQKELENIDYNIVRLRRLHERYQALNGAGAVSRQQSDEVRDELEHDQALRPLQAKSNAEQELLRREQLPRLRAQLRRMQEDLDVTRSKLDYLTVRAPVAGQMTSIDLKVGENRNRGDRFGELTPDTGFKLSATVEEFYLSRIAKGQMGTVSVGKASVPIRVVLVYPQIKNGVFFADLEFDAHAPPDLVPGQSLQGSLTLGGDVPGNILRAGPFLERTGGDWVFAVSQDETTAERRPLRLGRRNTRELEILSGLKPGEKAITSDYASFEHIQRIVLTH